MGKRSGETEDDYIRKKIRRLQKKLDKNARTTHSQSPAPTPPPPPPSPPSRESPPEPEPGPSKTPIPDQEASVEEDTLPEEYLLALGDEGQETLEVGVPIQPELAVRWSRIMCNGLGKEARDIITKKYPAPKNFDQVKAPILNPEILAAISEVTLKRDRRIRTRQEITGKIMTCLGRSLTNILRGNLVTKTLIEEISDAAKLAAEVFYQDSASRRFFALAGANQTVKEAVKETKADSFLFGQDCAEKIKAAQAIQKTGTQIKQHEAKVPTKGTSHVPLVKKQGNWKGPPQHQQHQHQHQRARGGQRPQPPRKFHQNANPPQQRDQRRYQHKSRPNYRRY